MKKILLDSIYHMFFPRKVACLISEDPVGIDIGLTIAKETGIDTDVYRDYKRFLFNIQDDEKDSYELALIYRNGSITSTEAICSFIKQRSANIQTIVFSGEKELRNKIDNLLPV